MLLILKQIKKLKAKDLKNLSQKLEIINLRQGSNLEYQLDEALNRCEYHFYGKNYSNEICPCSCYCINCELIPTDQLGQRMQELGQSITEKDIMLELVEHGYIKSINTYLGD